MSTDFNSPIQLPFPVELELLANCRKFPRPVTTGQPSDGRQGPFQLTGNRWNGKLGRSHGFQHTRINRQPGTTTPTLSRPPSVLSLLIYDILLYITRSLCQNPDKAQLKTSTVQYLVASVRSQPRMAAQYMNAHVESNCRKGCAMQSLRLDMCKYQFLQVCHSITVATC